MIVAEEEQAGAHMRNDVNCSLLDDPVLDPAFADMPAAQPVSRSERAWLLYLTLNLCFIAVLGLIDLSVKRLGHDPMVFLILLFALCSLPALVIHESNGRFCVLVIFLPVYFMYYGANDVFTYFVKNPGYWYGSSGSLLTDAEAVILAGLVSLLIGFRLAASLPESTSRRWLVLDWSVRATVLVGVLSMLAGLWAVWKLQLMMDFAAGSAKLDPFWGSLLIGARMMELVGAILLSYAYVKTRSRTLLWLIIGIIVMKVPLGIVLDSKEISISFPITFIATKWIYEGKLPLRWLGILSMFIVVVFPISYAYRATVLGGKTTRVAALKNVTANLRKAITESSKTRGGPLARGVESFVTRMDLKSVIAVTVHGTAHGVRFQNGYTLSPLLYAFIPRVILPDKPNVPTGQLYNRAFHISEDPDTFISTSFLGELYWNWGWVGALGGMWLIGISLGIVSTLFHVGDIKSVTRTLILMSAVYLLVVRLEDSLATQYVLMLRSLVIILALHVLFRRRSMEPVQQS